MSAGTGVLAKRSDLRWRRRAEDIPTLTALQDELLDSAAVLVRPNGILMYSTCSIEQDEGAERVAAFLERWQGQFVLENPHDAATHGVSSSSASSTMSQQASVQSGASSHGEAEGSDEEEAPKPVVAASWLMAAVTSSPVTERARPLSSGSSNLGGGGSSSGSSSASASLPSRSGSSSSADVVSLNGAATMVEGVRQPSQSEAAVRGPSRATHTTGGVPLSLITPEGYLTTLPHVHGMDGAFAARMRRVSHRN